MNNSKNKEKHLANIYFQVIQSHVQETRTNYKWESIPESSMEIKQLVLLCFMIRVSINVLGPEPRLHTSFIHSRCCLIPIGTFSRKSSKWRPWIVRRLPMVWYRTGGTDKQRHKIAFWNEVRISYKEQSICKVAPKWLERRPKLWVCLGHYKTADVFCNCLRK